MLIEMQPHEAGYCCQLLLDLSVAPPDDLDIPSYKQLLHHFNIENARMWDTHTMQFSKTQAEELYKILEYIQSLEPWAALPIASAIAKRLKAGIETYIPQEKLQ